MTNRVTIALPSKGTLADSTLNFLRSCDLRVRKSNPRQYTASMPALPQVDVLFQRVTDIVYKVADGTAQLGITGLDVVQEHPSDDVVVIHDNLGYGQCKLVIAVPESWIDVDYMTDLLEISLEFREHKRRNLRVVTKFPTLTRQFLHASGIHHFTIVESDGALEAAPALGYADIISDLTATGTTLRENHLKPLVDGVALQSQACLIANRTMMRQIPVARETTRSLLELIDATLQGDDYYSITVNMLGEDAGSIAELVNTNPQTRGLQGPTVSRVYAHNGQPKQGNWYAVTIIVRSPQLLAAVQHLRVVGGTQATVMPVRYVFMHESESDARLARMLSDG